MPSKGFATTATNSIRQLKTVKKAGVKAGLFFAKSKEQRAKVLLCGLFLSFVLFAFIRAIRGQILFQIANSKEQRILLRCLFFLCALCEEGACALALWFVFTYLLEYLTDGIPACAGMTGFFIRVNSRNSRTNSFSFSVI
jgi:hypothetical protein